jgi:ATP-dependent DNA helicase RecQ
VVRLDRLEQVEGPLGRHATIAKGVLDVLYAQPAADASVQRVQLELGRLLEQVGVGLPQPVTPAELERVLGWLHDQDVVRIDEGLNLVRQAFKLRVFRGKRLPTITRLYRERVEPWYEGQYRRTHLMVRYGQVGSRDQAAARGLMEAYFRLPGEEFTARYGLDRPEKQEELRRPILPADERRILDGLNSAQREVVDAAEPAVVVVAGPGSGKTRSIVHRIAALVKIQQVPPERILALAYNRNAVRELRVRLRDLIGPRAHALRVHTFHGLALAILGRTLGEVLRADPEDPTRAGRTGKSPAFDDLLREACDLLERGDADGGLPDDTVARRVRLLGGLEHIFVDEYQDVDALQYRFIQLLAGLGQEEEEPSGEGPPLPVRRVQIRLCVIGDDDQNIYAFRGASNRFLLQFEHEYAARRVLLTENYRSTEPIIEAANRLIAHNTDRCKRSPLEQVRIDVARRGQGARPVEAWRFVSPAALAAWVCRKVREWLGQGVAPCDVAILAPRWDDLGAVRLLLEREGIRSQALDRGPVRLVRNRAACLLLDALRKGLSEVIGPNETVEVRVRRFFQRRGRSTDEPTVCALVQIAQDLDRERGSGSGEELLPMTAEEVFEAIHEFDAANETHRDERTVLVTSCHGAKGLEFRKVILLTDGFEPSRSDVERANSWETAWGERRRLFYVAMTRAKDELVLCGIGGARLVQEAGLTARPVPFLEAELPARLVYLDLTPEDVDLGHRATLTQQDLIGRLHEGAPLRLRVNRFHDGWLVCTPEGIEVGDLSRNGDERLRERGLGAGSFDFRDGEVRVGRVFHHLKFNDVTGEKTEDRFVVIPQIRVCR